MRMGLVVGTGIFLVIAGGCSAPSLEQAPDTESSPTPTAVANQGLGNSRSQSDLPRVVLDDERLRDTLQRILTEEPGETTSSGIDFLAPGLGLIQLTRDPRFAPILVDMLGIPPYSVIYRQHVGDVLDGLTGEDIGIDWFTWVEWVAGQRELETPPLYGWWKGEILAQVDARFKEFLPGDEVAHSIRLEEIVWGGVGVDAIPALDHPTFTSSADATYLEPDEQVFGVSINGDVRAYPLRIMNWHEMANDTVGGESVSLSYCTLCNSGILFKTAREAEHEPFTFYTSGLLYRSNKLMFDSATKSLWNQFTGQPVVGPLVAEGIQLEILPVTLTTWEEWLSEHPDTQVLSLDTGYDRDYLKPGTEGAVYANYFASPSLLFPSGPRETGRTLRPKDQVFVLTVGGDEAKAYPLDLIRELGVVNDVVGGTPIVLLVDAGGGVQAYERGDEEFRLVETPALTLEDAEEGLWQATAEALKGPEGQQLRRLSGHASYWFAYRSFRPDGPLFTGE